MVPLSGSGFVCPNLPSGVVSWWRADSNALDSIGPNHGVLANGATYAAGKVGPAFSLDGVNARVVVPTNGLNFRTGDFTAEGWIKTSSVKAYNAIFTFDSYNPAIYVLGSGVLHLWNASATSSSNGFNDGLFHHFAVVRQSGTVTYYKDGVAAGTATSTTDINPSFTAIGTSTYGGENFPGLIDELTFYNRALNPSEIASIFSAGSAGKCPGTNSMGTNTITGPLIELAPTAPDFAYVAVGQSNDVSLTLSNSGNASLVISNLITSNPRFTIVSPPDSFVVATGAQRIVTLRFTPAAEGLQVGFLAISNNSAHGTFYVSLRGIGALASRPRGGLVYGWGYNAYGMLGNGTLNDSTVPVAVLTNGALTGKTITAIDSSDFTSLALDSEGKVYSWGRNEEGQLGIGAISEFTNVPVAVDMSGVLKGKTVMAVACASYHSVALTTDGRVYAWGFNYSGELGNGTSGDPVTVPVAIEMGGALAGKKVTAIAAHGFFTLALTSDGMIYGWGNNHDGYLGNGTTNDSQVPVPVSTTGALSGKVVIAIVAGTYHSLALTSEGRVYAWGRNDSAFSGLPAGQLGTGATNNSSVPVAVDTSGALNGKTVIAIAGAFDRSLALTSEGRAYDWGSDLGRLGTGTSDATNSAVPVAVSTNGALGGKIVVGIAGGIGSSSVDGHSVALTSDGNIFTWGGNYEEALGAGLPFSSFRGTNAPVAVDTSGLLSGKAVTAISAGYNFSLVIASTNTFPGSTNSGPVIELAPTAPDFGFVGPGQFTDVSLTLSNAGTATLVISNLITSNPRFTVVSPATPFNIAAGAAQTVTLRFTPATQSLQVGYLALSNNSANGTFYVPLRGVGATSSRSQTGTAFAWGDNSKGELGAGLDVNTFLNANRPVAVVTNGMLVGKTLAILAAGNQVVFAVDSAGRVYGWGDEGYGELGNGVGDGGSVITTNVPVTVQMNGVLAGKQVASVSAGYGTSVALTSDGRLYSWGFNGAGALGNGSSGPVANVPVAVTMSGALAGKRITAVATGAGQTLALASDGKVYAWGYNNYGQLGDGTTNSSSLPIAVDTTGALSGKVVVAISANRQSLALTSDGLVYAWGANFTGELGNGQFGTDAQVSLPVAVDTSGVLNGKTVVAISAAYGHSYALTSDAKSSAGELTVASWEPERPITSAAPFP